MRWLIAAGSLALLSGGTALAQPVVGEMQLPVRPTCLTSPYGIRPAPGPHGLGFHNGIDLRAPAGGAVYAVADGRVLTVHRGGPGGLEIILSHKGRVGSYATLYAHLGILAPAIAMGRGEVKAGERIAVIGRSGVTYGTHLFFALSVGGHAVDPAPYFPVGACEGKVFGPGPRVPPPVSPRVGLPEAARRDL